MRCPPSGRAPAAAVSELVALAVVPFVPIHAPTPSPAGFADCAARQLHASVSLQGATGSQLGGLALRNVSGSGCVLRTPLRLALVDGGARLPLSRVGSSAALGFHALLLRPRRAGAARLQLFNACGEHPSARLFVVLARRGGLVPLGIAAEGRCDSPGSPPAWAIGPLERADPPALTRAGRAQHAALRVRAVRVPASVRAGTVLRFTVTLAAVRTVPARPCPLFYEQLWLWKQQRVVTEQYVLNCHPVGAAFAAGRPARFAMRLRVPAAARGRASVEWGLEDAVVPVPRLAPLNELLNAGAGPSGYSAGYRGNDLDVVP